MLQTTCDLKNPQTENNQRLGKYQKKVSSLCHAYATGDSISGQTDLCFNKPQSYIFLSQQISLITLNFVRIVKAELLLFYNTYCLIPLIQVNERAVRFLVTDNYTLGTQAIRLSRMRFRLSHHPLQHSGTRLRTAKYPQLQKFRKHLLVALQVELVPRLLVTISL